MFAPLEGLGAALVVSLALSSDPGPPSPAARSLRRCWADVNRERRKSHLTVIERRRDGPVFEECSAKDWKAV